MIHWYWLIVVFIIGFFTPFIVLLFIMDDENGYEYKK